MLASKYAPQQEDKVISKVGDSQDSFNKFKRYYLVSDIDYFSEAGSLFIKFDEKDDLVLKSDAFVLIGIKNNRISSVEILLSDNEVINKLSEYLIRENSD